MGPHREVVAVAAAAALAKDSVSAGALSFAAVAAAAASVILHPDLLAENVSPVPSPNPAPAPAFPPEHYPALGAKLSTVVASWEGPPSTQGWPPSKES